ncbi:MAG: AAA family ATPase [Cyanobacteria bacterium J06643_5]
MVSIPGYEVNEQLYNGSRTLVYRAVRDLDEKPVVIKLLKNPYPNFNELLQFRNQYTISKNLDIPGIVRPYSLEAYENSYILIMEDFGGISLHEYIKRENIISLKDILSIGLQITDILHDIHQNRVIHKDIKPANILINPETNQIKLIDFSIASLLPKETQEIKNPSGLEGTLAYISPEQTGRMNRGIDYRSDFYSLGVTLYELLTGELPFKSDDAMELVHCHIAKQPPAMVKPHPNFLLVNENKPHPNPLLGKERGQEIPQILSDIVMKLMAKNAEDRYQSALGLKYDLEICLKQLKETGNIENFEIGKRDICDRFIIPEKLYGRENEVQELLAAFERVSQGNRELMLVAGFSGIGKTAVVNEVHKPIVKQRGYFIQGKFDQFNRNIPFSAFVQAFRNLMGQLLSESDTQLASWKNKILKALGENAQVILDVIPELKQIIGKQPDVLELFGTAAQNRFNLIFKKFIQVFTAQEHPLVIFLDDLQWADSDSFKLMQVLMSESETNYLLLIGAYRDNEVFPAHPLMLTLEEIGKAAAIINTITLEPLNQESLNQLIADTLNCDLEISQRLTEIVYQKTQGNPFFSTQLLKSLYEDSLIKFDFYTSSWECDISQVRMLSLSSDVVEFMGLQLKKLPESTQNVLKLAACIGNQFDLATLAIICKKSEAETASDLWTALQESLVLPQSEVYKFYLESELQSRHESEDEQIKNSNSNYKFLHDRIQQAAYSLIPDEQKQQTHYQIGQLLLQKKSLEAREKCIFDIVNQLNYGLDFIADQAEKEKLAQLNIIAGRKAKSSTAYGAALKYFSAGRNLLGKEGWNICYELTLLIYEESAETAYLNTDFYKAEELAKFVLEEAKNLLDKINIYIIKIHSNIAQVKLLKAIEIAQKVLHLIDEDINLPTRPLPSDFEKTLLETQSNIGDNSITNLLYLPQMEDPYKLAAIRILASVAPPAYFAFPTLLPLIAMKMVNLSIKYGNTSSSAFGYAIYGFILCGVVNDIEAGSQFGQLALNLVDRFDAKDIESKVLLLAGHFIKPWQESISECLALLTQGYQVSLEAGDLQFAAYSASFYCYNCILIGKELESLEIEISAYEDAIAELKQDHTLDQLSISRQTILNLLNRSKHPCELIGEAYDESQMVSLHKQANNRTTLAFLYISKLNLCYLFENYEQAAENAIQAQKYLDGVVAMPCIVVFYFYDSLVKLARYQNVSNIEQKEIIQQVEQNQIKMQYWADKAPMNNLHKLHLVEAEKYRVLGKKLEAIELYDKAIAGAKDNEYIQEQALSNELAAKFYLNWDKEKVAAGYMQEAYYCYARWGAKAKTDDLEKHYPQLLAPILQAQKNNFQINETQIQSLQTIQTTHSSSSICEALDFASILKATRALSSEIQLEDLISSLLQIVIENAGAEKAALIFLREDNFYLEAIAAKDNSVRRLSIPYENSNDIPHSVINYVKHSLKTIILDKAKVNKEFISDEYLIQHQPKSLLCTPILNKGELTGLLYLENKLTIGSFTKERLKVIDILCSQAAISLENSRLYQILETRESKFRSFVEDVDDLMYSVSTDGKFTYISPQFKQMWGYDVNEFINQPFAPIVHPDDLLIVELASKQVIETGKKYSGIEFRTQHRDGSWLWIVCNNSPIKDENEKVIGLRGIARDITDRKQAEAAVINKSQELEKTLQELKQTQLQMVQNEKMATLGNLVAGVAHEVNNPIGFLTGSISNAEDYIKDLFAHIECYQENYPSPEEEVIENAEEIDLEYLSEDLPKLLNSMKLATERIKDISTSLRTFSRADTSKKVACNIHKGIDSTILILKYRLKANDKRPAIEVIKNYGELPQVKCFLGQLNQVFMNIIANAIDALDIVSEGKLYSEIQDNPHKIIITTKVSEDNNTVLISFKDNGSGIPESVKERIFDNLFTTKGVGKGTGLGLAIAKQIVEETHNGEISCNSTVGEGTEFTIKLPIC